MKLWWKPFKVIPFNCNLSMIFSTENFQVWIVLHRFLYSLEVRCARKTLTKKVRVIGEKMDKTFVFHLRKLVTWYVSPFVSQNRIFNFVYCKCFWKYVKNIWVFIRKINVIVKSFAKNGLNKRSGNFHLEDTPSGC